MYYNMTNAEIKQNKLDMVNWLVSRPTWGESWRKYYNGSILTAARLTGGELVEIEKCHMETRFCFGYGYNGADFENESPAAHRAAARARDSFPFFLSENLEGVKRDLKWLYTRRRELNMWGDKRYLVVVTTVNQIFATDVDYWGCFGYRTEAEIKARCGENTTIRELNEQDINILIAAHKVRLADIAKRCKTYWKRYGGSKLTTWTYLRD